MPLLTIKLLEGWLDTFFNESVVLDASYRYLNMDTVVYGCLLFLPWLLLCFASSRGDPSSQKVFLFLSRELRCRIDHGCRCFRRCQEPQSLDRVLVHEGVRLLSVVMGQPCNDRSNQSFEIVYNIHKLALWRMFMCCMINLFQYLCTNTWHHLTLPQQIRQVGREGAEGVPQEHGRWNRHEAL